MQFSVVPGCVFTCWPGLLQVEGWGCSLWQCSSGQTQDQGLQPPHSFPAALQTNAKRPTGLWDVMLCTEAKLLYTTSQDLSIKPPPFSEKSIVVGKKIWCAFYLHHHCVQQTDFKYLYYLKNVYFVLVMSTETEHSMGPLVSLNLFKKHFRTRQQKDGWPQRTAKAFISHWTVQSLW